MKCFVNIWVELIGFLALSAMYVELLVCRPFLSKIENRLQRRPRSTSMKDRQNSKAQSDRTSSMESECSPDSRLIAQVKRLTDVISRRRCALKICLWKCAGLGWSVSNSLLLVCLEGSQEVCVWPAEPDPDLWRTPTREHHSHQHHGVARTGVCFSMHNTQIYNRTLESCRVGLTCQSCYKHFLTLLQKDRNKRNIVWSLDSVYPSGIVFFPTLPFVYSLAHHVPLMCVSVQYVAELLHEQAQPIVSTCSAADVQAAFNTIVTRIQRLWVTYIHTHILEQSSPNCMFMVAHRQRISGRNHSHCWSAVFACFLMKSLLQFSLLLLLFFFGSICSAAISSGSHDSGRRGCLSLLCRFC